MRLGRSYGFHLSDLFDQPMCMMKRQNLCTGLIARANTCSFREEIGLTPVGLSYKGVFCVPILQQYHIWKDPRTGPSCSLLYYTVKLSAHLGVVLTPSQTLYPRCLVDLALFQQVMCIVFCHHSCPHPITALDSDQRQFLYAEWEGYTAAAYFNKEELYLNTLFKCWARLFPMDDYNESTDDKEKAFIQRQVEKVRDAFSRNSAATLSNHYAMTENGELFAMDCTE